MNEEKSKYNKFTSTQKNTTYFAERFLDIINIFYVVNYTNNFILTEEINPQKLKIRFPKIDLTMKIRFFINICMNQDTRIN